MVVAMRMRLLLAVVFVLILSLPAWTQDTADEDIPDSSSGPVEMEPDTSEDVITIPMDEESRTVNWAEYLALPPGVGANWGYVTVLYPPDPGALFDCPNILLDSAWSPPIPFSYGFEPSASTRLTTTGWWYLEDSTGNLARRDMTITADGMQWIATTWFMAGTSVLQIEEGWETSYLADVYYLPDEWSGPGIEYFLKTVWFRGVTSGERMQQLLAICNAQRIGRDVMNGGRDRNLIYQIPSNELDRQNGRGSLLVWLSVGYYKLIQTRLHTAYATEVTIFENVQESVDLDPMTYYSDWLPEDVYWSMDHYLLTHETPFFSTPDSFSFTGNTTMSEDSDTADEEAESSETEDSDEVVEESESEVSE